ncbi:MAG TPA: hypothetical protein VI542_29400, partial [Candidatus Tectomicrobia bacterium]
MAVVLRNWTRQGWAGEAWRRGDTPVMPLPVIGEEQPPLSPDGVEESWACRIITPTQHPGHGSPSHRIRRAPTPSLLCLLLRTCHLASRVKVTVP